MNDELMVILVMKNVVFVPIKLGVLSFIIDVRISGGAKAKSQEVHYTKNLENRYPKFSDNVYFSKTGIPDIILH